MGRLTIAGTVGGICNGIEAGPGRLWKTRRPSIGALALRPRPPPIATMAVGIRLVAPVRLGTRGVGSRNDLCLIG
jgi:hypothetical protein